MNAICRAAGLGQLDPHGLAEALADLTSDFVSGHFRQADILWRASLNEAAELSQRHTPKRGTRSLDVLHVARAGADGIAGSGGVVDVLDPAAAQRSQTFYRLVLLP